MDTLWAMRSLWFLCVLWHFVEALAALLHLNTVIIGVSSLQVWVVSLGICCGSLGTTLKVGAGTTVCGGARMSCRVLSWWIVVDDKSGMVATMLGLLRSVPRVLNVASI